MKILNKSKYFSSYTFSGGFDIKKETLDFFEEHYELTGENLIDDYCEVVYLSWEYENEDYYLDKDEYIKKEESVSKIRRLRKFDIELIYDAKHSLSKARANYKIHQEILDNEPRREAQKFIGNKKIRKEIFKLYGKKCLCCGSTENISLDHIIPIFLKGENKIDNLQPLCRSCNSRKGTNIIDYR